MKKRWRYRRAASTHNAVQEIVDRTAREVMDPVGVSAAVRMFYMSFAREVWGCWNRCPALRLDAELEVVLFKWRARGLDPAILAPIRDRVLDVLDGMKRKPNGSA